MPKGPSIRHSKGYRRPCASLSQQGPGILTGCTPSRRPSFRKSVIYKKEEKPVENKMPEQSERQYNLYWMIRMSPFTDYSDEEVQAAIEKKVRELNRTLKTQPVEKVRVKNEKKVAKLESLSGNRDAIAEERDQAILHFNRNMIEDNNGEVPTDPAKISATVSREGWADGTGLVNVDGMPHCPRCGYINRKTKVCVNCGSKLKF